MIKRTRTYTSYNPSYRKINNASHNSVMMSVIEADEDNSGLILLTVITTLAVTALIFIGLLIIL